jgi:hypothetical protein
MLDDQRRVWRSGKRGPGRTRDHGCHKAGDRSVSVRSGDAEPGSRSSGADLGGSSMAQARLIATAVGLAIAVVACGFIPSAYRMELFRSSWTVTALDGQPVAGPIGISFNEGGVESIVTVHSACGAVQRHIDMDSDGDGIAFWGAILPGSSCPDDTWTEVVAVLGALGDSEEWHVGDDDHITLEGPHSLALTRAT